MSIHLWDTASSPICISAWIRGAICCSLVPTTSHLFSLSFSRSLFFSPGFSLSLFLSCLSHKYLALFLRVFLSLPPDSHGTPFDDRPAFPFGPGGQLAAHWFAVTYRIYMSSISFLSFSRSPYIYISFYRHPWGTV